MLWSQSLLWLQISYTLKSVAAAEFNALSISMKKKTPNPHPSKLKKKPKPTDPT